MEHLHLTLILGIAFLLVFLVIAVIAMRWSNRDITVKMGKFSLETKTSQHSK
jgi:Na+-transporting methylmalonyl-CoA/oxaloacetate decarboxylase gamma subunit